MLFYLSETKPASRHMPAWLRVGVPVLLTFMLVVALFSPSISTTAAAIPTFTPTNVVTDKTITIQTFNFPAGTTFVCRIGEYGALGVGGVVVGSVDSGAGGSFSATFNIPAEFKGRYRLAIRLDSTAGYYSYNWFYNDESKGTGGTGGPSTPSYSGIPTFDITNTKVDEKVTVKTNNFPSGQTFTVRMGKYGTLGIGGVVVGTTDSGTGGSLTASYDIPASLKGLSKIAIRMDSDKGYYSYNWFVNATGTGTGGTGGITTGYTGIPTTSIVSVVPDDKVTIKTYNFPASQKFTVRIGAYGTLGVGGVVVAETDSGSGGSFEVTYSIPDALKGKAKLAIRLDSSQGYYAYDWFVNTAGGTGEPVTPPGYSGYPTFDITSNSKDSTVTIQTHNLTPHTSFTVRMGAYGTLGIGGVVVATTDSGDGYTQTFTYNIPDSLKGSAKLAIRMDSASGYYAYDWFFND
jgi:hypothetical protein